MEERMAIILTLGSALLAGTPLLTTLLPRLGEKVQELLIIILGAGTGLLLGTAALHPLPAAATEHDFTTTIGTLFLAGYLLHHAIETYAREKGRVMGGTSARIATGGLLTVAA